MSNDYNPMFRTCEVCGKSFIIQSTDYVYKHRQGHGSNQRILWFCGWSHMREWEAEHEKKKKRGRNKQADFG